MLLKFTASDMLNTSLVNVETGEQAFNIATVLLPAETLELPEIKADTPFTCSSQSTSPTMASSSPKLEKKPRKDWDDEPCSLERRQTIIADVSGKIVCSISWKGRRPEITIHDEKVGALTDLFGSSTVRFMPKVLAIPTRFDTEYVWTATEDSLTLFDYDTETAKGTFHQNVIRIPGSSKSKKLGSPSKLKLSSPSRPSLSPPSPVLSSSSSTTSDADAEPKKSTFISTHLPGLGSNYLEFSSHPLADDVEIILSFLMMEILRRGRFNLTPYTFERPKLWQFKEARDLFMRRLRRNTV